MKAIAFANRLMRDLKEKSINDLTADTRLELLDAINGGLQKMHAIAASESKTTTVSIALDAPATISIGVTNGSTTTTGTAFTSDQIYRTVQVAGDSIENQITGTNSLLHPYGGVTGTVAATIYCDCMAIPEPYSEIVGDPRVLEDGFRLTNFKIERDWNTTRAIRRPIFYWMEPNAANQNPPAPAVMRFDSLPDKLYRLECRATLAPARIAFTDLLAPDTDIPLRAEQVESYLLPIARGLLANSEMWRDESTKAGAESKANAALAAYELLTPRTLSTPNNRARTKAGF